MKLRHCMFAVALLAATAGQARADAIGGTLYDTTFAGGENVWKVDFNYDGGLDPFTSFSLTNDTNIASIGGADGIVFDPVTGKLLVGGQGTVNDSAIYLVDPDGIDPTLAMDPGEGVASYHVSIDPNGKTAWTSTCCGPAGANLGEVPLDPFSDGTGRDVTGDAPWVDTLAWVPNKVGGGYTTWYTYSDQNGGECIGTIDMSTFATTNVICDLPASHGMVFDPLSQTLILMGDGHISQWDPYTNTLVGDIDVLALACQLNPAVCGGQANFDQGTVDGQGHILAAMNNGFLVFVDYSSALGYDIDDYSFIGAAFLRSNLDDIAPLVGPGAPPPVPEPVTLSLLGMGLAATGRRAWKRRPTRA